jgi:DNA-binding PadR family transcriptional regulator
MRRIEPGNVKAQLARMTPLTQKILIAAADGTDMYGRIIAQQVETPYPQVYHTLSTLKARGFLDVMYGEDEHANRKLYTLTSAGCELVDQIRGREFPETRIRQRVPVNPEIYADRMRASSLLRWLQELGIVDSYEELKHVSTCEKCTELIRVYVVRDRSDARCNAYAETREGTS